MTSAEAAKREYPGVMWQGYDSDITDIQHLLDSFVIHFIGRKRGTQTLAIVLATQSGDPMLPGIELNLGDTIILREDDHWVPDSEKSDSIGIIRAPEGEVQ